MYMRRKNIRGPCRVSEEDAQRDLEAMRGASSLTAVREVARQLKEAAVQERQATMSASFSDPARQDDDIRVSDGGGGAQDGQEVEQDKKEDEESEEYEAGGGTAAKKEGEEEEEEEEEEGEEEVEEKGKEEEAYHEDVWRTSLPPGSARPSKV